MSARPATPLPEFEDPPVSEVALSVQFAPLETWRSPHAGDSPSPIGTVTNKFQVRCSGLCDGRPELCNLAAQPFFYLERMVTIRGGSRGE
jgi:hypothetical protein